MSTLVSQSPFRLGSGLETVNSTPSKWSAYSLIRPRRFSLRSMIQASFSLSIPAGSWMNPLLSDIVTGLPPRSRTFSQACWATLPEPLMATVAPSKDLPLVASISRAK